MNLWKRLAARVYHLLLAFYPPGFRNEYQEEMQSVFLTSLSANDLPWQVLWRELRDWPAAVITEHLRERRKVMSMNTEKITGQPKNTVEWGASLVLFLIPLIYPIINLLMINDVQIPDWLSFTIQYIIFGILILSLGYGIFKSLPRWVLPYFGFALIAVFIWGRIERPIYSVYPYFIDTFGPRSYWPLAVRIGYSGLFMVFFAIVILVSGLLMVSLLRLMPFTRRAWQRIRADWTQISYLLYGGLILVILFTFDEYRYDEALKTFLWITLALGSWLYLRAKTKKSRIRILLGSATLVMLTIAIAKWVLIPFQAWPDGYPESPTVATRWTETISAVLQWAFFLVILYSPALLDRLPGKPAQPASIVEDTASA